MVAADLAAPNGCGVAEIAAPLFGIDSAVSGLSAFYIVHTVKKNSLKTRHFTPIL